MTKKINKYNEEDTDTWVFPRTYRTHANRDSIVNLITLEGKVKYARSFDSYDEAVEFYHKQVGQPIEGLKGLMNLCCDHFNVKVEDILSKSRKRQFIEVRHSFFYLAHKYYKKTSLRNIAKAGGRSDHSTVLNAVENVEASISIYKDIAEEFKYLEDKVRLNREE